MGSVSRTAQELASASAGGRPDELKQSAVVEAVNPFEGCLFDSFEVAPRTTMVDDLCFEQTVDRLGQGVVIAVADAAAVELQPVKISYPWSPGRCCRTLAAADSQRKSMRLDRPHEQAITCPLPHDELVQLHRLASQARVFADLAEQGDGLGRAA